MGEHTERRMCNIVGNVKTSLKKKLKNNAVKCAIVAKVVSGSARMDSLNVE